MLRLISTAALASALSPLAVSATPTPAPNPALRRIDTTKLPPSTEIHLKSGAIITRAQSMSEHEARVRRFANAKALAANMTFRPYHAIKNPAPAPSGISIGALDAGRMHSVPVAVPHLIALNLSGTHFAKDYADFCAAAKASACLYVPVIGGSLVYDGSGNLSESDYEVNQQQCSAEGGSWFDDGSGGGYGTYGCNYIYPSLSTARWIETTPTSAQISASTCVDPSSDTWLRFTNYLDPRGVYTMTFNRQDTTPMIDGIYSCVVQVTATT